MRLIDADKLWKATTTSIDECEDFLELIEKQPTADRPQGEWIEIGTISHSYKCSVCGRTIFHTTVGKSHVAKYYPYCHCGADMREK